MIADLRSAYLFLSFLQARVGASIVRRLGEADPREILTLPAEELFQRLKLTGNGRKAFEALEHDFDPDEVLSRLAERNFRAITLADEDYPEKLSEMPDPPPTLFVNGEIPEVTTVALVGSRKASATGVEAAHALGRALGERGVCVVSGLALGVDAAAHQGALTADGPTLGVLGCGIDVVDPTTHKTT